jgi:hypothetical protein
MADNLPPLSADVTEYGSFNLAEPFGTHRPVMGKLYLYFFIFCLRGYLALVFGVGHVLMKKNEGIDESRFLL